MAGPAMPPGIRAGNRPGRRVHVVDRSEQLPQTRAFATPVVWLPEWKTAAYTVLPSGVAARRAACRRTASTIVERRAAERGAEVGRRRTPRRQRATPACSWRVAGSGGTAARARSGRGRGAW